MAKVDYEEIIDTISKQAVKQYKKATGWITDHKPKSGDYILATLEDAERVEILKIVDVNGELHAQCYSYTNGFEYHDLDMLYVTAWLPLPEPYREGKDDE